MARTEPEPSAGARAQFRSSLGPLRDRWGLSASTMSPEERRRILEQVFPSEQLGDYTKRFATLLSLSTLELL